MKDSAIAISTVVAIFVGAWVIEMFYIYSNEHTPQALPKTYFSPEIATLQAQVRELSCEVKGGVWKDGVPQVTTRGSTTYFNFDKTHDTCTKGGMEYTYQDGSWVSTKQTSL